MPALRTTVRIAAIAGLLALLVPLAEPVWWGFGLPVHFPLQLAAGSLLFVTIALTLRERAAVAALAVVALIAGWQLRDHLPRLATAQASDTDLVAVTLNLDWRNSELDRIVDYLRRLRADVVALPEYTPAAAAGLVELRELYPYRLEAPAQGAFGIALYSRHPIVTGTVIHPSATDNPAIDATVALPAGSATEEIRVIAVHPRPPISGRYVAERDAKLAAIAERVATDERTTLVLGDFNDTPFSASFRRFMAQSGLRNPAIGRGYPATFPAGWLPLWIPIDHCLYRGALRPVGIHRGPDIGADHYPLVAEFSRTAEHEKGRSPL